MSGELISVIIPIYNYSKLLAATVNSVIKQTYTNWECIIIDDGSTDNTKAVAEQLASTDNRIKYYYQSNAGLSASRNKGIQLARGKYIQFLDADDVLHPEKFTKQLEIFRNKPATDIVYSDYRWFKNTTQDAWLGTGYYSAIKGDACKAFILKWEKGFSIPIHSYLFNHSCFAKWGLFDQHLPTHEDLDLQLRFALNGAKYEYNEGVMAYYRVHESNMAKNLTLMHKGYLLTLLKVYSNPSYKLAYQSMAIHRYFEEIFNSLLDTLRRRKNNFLSSIAVPSGYIYSFIGIILCPVYLILKLIEKIKR